MREHPINPPAAAYSAVEGILFYTADTNNQQRLNQLKSFAGVRTFLRQLQSHNPSLWFNFSVFGIGAGAAINAIINQVNEQNLRQLELDEGRAETQELLAA